MSQSMLSTVIKPMHREGWRFVGAFAAATLVLGWIWDPLFWLGAVLTVWCYYFFRDPKRVTPDRPGLVISPADGVVSLIGPAVPPPELGLGPETRMRVCVFMNVFNCHVNRVPVPGTITKVAYHPGQFLNASLDKASDLNERNGLVVTMDDGRTLGVVQIAGLVARRILCEVHEGARLAAGDRIGLIRFGSRVDVYLPQGSAPLVCLGQTMVAGETVIADLASDEPARRGREA